MIFQSDMQDDQEILRDFYSNIKELTFLGSEQMRTGGDLCPNFDARLRKALDDKAEIDRRIERRKLSLDALRQN